MKRALFTALAVVLAALLLIGCLQRLVVFPRYLVQRPPDDPPAVPGLERLWLEIDGGRVEAFFLPGKGVDADHPGPALIFAHGNGELIDYWPELLAPYREMGVSVLLPEYRGYGRSDGSPSEEAIASDFERFYHRLAERADVDSSRIVFHGRSLGGGVACALAARQRPAALILTSTFTSIRAMAKRYLVPGSLIRDPFDNVNVISSLDRPILIGHGDADRTVPISHARTLYAAAPDAQLLVEPGSGHDYPREPEVFFNEVESFLHGAGVLSARD
jgi:pimeloyl-ACP methyl ester carboxylesterase